MPNLTNSQEPEPSFFLDPLSRSRSRSKKIPEPLGKKIRSRSRLGEKSGAGAVKKFAGSPALLKLKKAFNKTILEKLQMGFEAFFAFCDILCNKGN